MIAFELVAKGGYLMKIANIIAYILVLVGALNWGIFAFSGFNLVGWIFMGARTIGSIVVYSLVALSAIWLIISPILTQGKLILGSDN